MPPNRRIRERRGFEGYQNAPKLACGRAIRRSLCSIEGGMAYERNQSSPRRGGVGSADYGHMKYPEPPDKLPVLPESTEPNASPFNEPEPTKDIHFRDRSPGVSVRTNQASATTPAMLTVADVAAMLSISVIAVYGLVRRRRIAHYRLPGGIRFKPDDVHAFLKARRHDS